MTSFDIDAFASPEFSAFVDTLLKGYDRTALKAFIDVFHDLSPVWHGSLLEKPLLSMGDDIYELSKAGYGAVKGYLVAYAKMARMEGAQQRLRSGECKAQMRLYGETFVANRDAHGVNYGNWSFENAVSCFAGIALRPDEADVRADQIYNDMFPKQQTK
ncbi:Uncharacterised protein [uncultured archaeon]|nr:Uncharacterised protein [uncultured archaeon]